MFPKSPGSYDVVGHLLAVMFLHNLLVEWSEAMARRHSVENVFIKISQNSQENTCARASFLIKLQMSPITLLEKETLAKAFSCEISQIFKNTFSYRAPLVTNSEWYSLWDSLKITRITFIDLLIFFLIIFPFDVQNLCYKSKDNGPFLDL